MAQRKRWNLPATVIIALAILGGIVGWQQSTLKPAPPTTIMITPTVTTVAVSQTTVVSTGGPRLFRLCGKIFFDYNGDGKQGENEPCVSGVIIALNGYNITSSNSTGWYMIDKVTYGMNTIRPFPPRNFRYMCESATEFRSVEEPYRVLVLEDSRKDIGLMEGFLTLPFSGSARVRGEPYYVDLDLGPGMRDWKGGNRVGHDNHYGIDYDMPEGESIVAPAPGVVIEAEGSWPNVSKDPSLGLWDDGNRIVINHGRLGPYNRDFYTIYCHLKKILCTVGQRVSRGEKIAESGNTGAKTGGPHLHFQCGGFGLRRLDPYRDLLNPSSISYWTRDNSPQFPQ